MRVTIKDCSWEKCWEVDSIEKLEDLYTEIYESLWDKDEDDEIVRDFLESLDEFDEAFQMLDIDFWDFSDKYGYKFSWNAEKAFNKMIKAYNEFLKAIDPDWEWPQD